MKNSIILSIGVFIVAVLYPAASYSCFGLPADVTSSPSNLVLKADYIVLAEAKKELSGDGTYPTEFLFETKEVLKGEAPDQFKYYGFKRTEDQGTLEDFDAHKNPRFWAYGYGNSTSPAWCGVYGIFEEGQTYLIIDSDKGHLKGYENIRSEDDLWLGAIRLLVNDMGDTRFSEDTSFVPQADSLSECIKNVVGDDSLIFVRHTAIEVCLDRHSTE